jgi:hypothetical protein
MAPWLFNHRLPRCNAREVRGAVAWRRLPSSWRIIQGWTMLLLWNTNCASGTAWIISILILRLDVVVLVTLSPASTLKCDVARPSHRSWYSFYSKVQIVNSPSATSFPLGFCLRFRLHVLPRTIQGAHESKQFHPRPSYSKHGRAIGSVASGLS